MQCVRFCMATLFHAHRLSFSCITNFTYAFVIEMKPLSPNDRKWTHERKTLLITTRLRHEGEFVNKKRKKISIWEQILREIKDVDATFPFTRDEIMRSFMNIMVTYKRIKKRNGTSGESATNWEYFEALDEVFGSRSCVQVPEDMTESSLQNLMNTLEGENETSSDTETPSTTNLTPTTGMKRKKNDVIDFLTKESEKDEAIMQKLLKTEEDKVSIEREKLEELKQIRLLFATIAQK